MIVLVLLLKNNDIFHHFRLRMIFSRMLRELFLNGCRSLHDQRLKIGLGLLNGLLGFLTVILCIFTPLKICGRLGSRRCCCQDRIEALSVCSINELSLLKLDQLIKLRLSFLEI